MASNFDKFTERARKVLSLAQEEAQRFPIVAHHEVIPRLLPEGLAAFAYGDDEA